MDEEEIRRVVSAARLASSSSENGAEGAGDAKNASRTVESRRGDVPDASTEPMERRTSPSK